MYKKARIEISHLAPAWDFCPGVFFTNKPYLGRRLGDCTDKIAYFKFWGRYSPFWWPFWRTHSMFFSRLLNFQNCSLCWVCANFFGASWVCDKKYFSHFECAQKIFGHTLSMCLKAWMCCPWTCILLLSMRKLRIFAKKYLDVKGKI